MRSQLRFSVLGLLFALLVQPSIVNADEGPYAVYPDAEPPYYRVRFDGSTEEGKLIFAVNYTMWIPPGVSQLRGVVVHQHGCGEGSCKSGLTGAFDLHWQSLAAAHDCALLSPAYEQSENADCQMWCDPRNGSAEAFQRGLKELGKLSGHPELSEVPWALWGHSGGGHWAGGMVMLYPERVAAAWLRSGVPLLEADPKRPNIRAHSVSDAVYSVPMMCNLGTKEGVTVTNDRFSGVWPANELFFKALRPRGGLVGIAIDPLTSHECGNQRYLAIPWLDACLTLRLPKDGGTELRAMPSDQAWLAMPLETAAVASSEFKGETQGAVWLPNEVVAKKWMEYVNDTQVGDSTAPPTPVNVRIEKSVLRWDCKADLESGLAGFVIQFNGETIATIDGKNRFGRPLFQDLQYSDTPSQPLVEMSFRIPENPSNPGAYRVVARNTAGLSSEPSAAAIATPEK